MCARVCVKLVSTSSAGLRASTLLNPRTIIVPFIPDAGFPPLGIIM